MQYRQTVLHLKCFLTSYHCVRKSMLLIEHEKVWNCDMHDRIIYVILNAALLTEQLE